MSHELNRLRSLVGQYELVLGAGEKYVAEQAAEWKAIAERLREMAHPVDQDDGEFIAAFDRKAGKP